MRFFVRGSVSRAQNDNVFLPIKSLSHPECRPAKLLDEGSIPLKILLNKS